MKTEVILEQSIGKTLQGYESSITCGQMVISFTDGTFTALGIERYDPDYATIVGEPLVFQDFGDELLTNLGVATTEELKELRNKRNAEFNKKLDAREHAEFLRLKRKFGEVK